MPTIGSTSTFDVLESLPTNNKVSRLDMPLANTEYSFSLQDGVKALELILLDEAVLSFSFVSGQSGNGYEVSSGTAWHKDLINLSGFTLYAQSDKPNQTLVIGEWY